MRLRRLDLVRYGKFTDRTLDFGPRPDGAPDLHLVYGPNEAGKSTALSAYLDLLFGIGLQSPYGFLHPYATMRIGGALDLAEGTREFVRIKRSQNSLLDARDQPLPADAVLAELGGIERDAYRAMFSLDDETLEAGGEAILASRGDLGELLFSATAGLADLGRKLSDVRAEADRFYRYRARGGALLDAKARLAALKAERERIDTLASDYAALTAERDRTAAQYDAALAERRALAEALDAIERKLSALPRLAVLRALRDRLAPLADLPEIAEGFGDELPDLRREEVELAVHIEAAASTLATLDDEIAGVAVDERALQAASALARLEELRPRHVTAEADIPVRRIEAREQDRRIADTLRRLDRADEADPRRLLLGASLSGRLRDLMEARSGVVTALSAAQAELSQARQALDEAQDALRQASNGERLDEPSVAALTAMVGLMRQTDHGPRRRAAARDVESARAALAEALEALRPWRGDLAKLTGMVVPSATTIRQWQSREEELRDRLRWLADEVERHRTESLRLDAERSAMTASTGIVSDREADDVRTAREHAWAEHRRRLDPATADVFEAALRRDDGVTARRAAHAAEIARLNDTLRAAAVADAAHARAVELHATAQAARVDLDAEVASAVQRMDPALAIALASIEGWLSAREQALAAGRRLDAATRDLRDIEVDAAASRETLAAALAAAGIEPAAGVSFEMLLGAAQRVIDGDTTLKAMRRAVADRRRAVADREHAAGRAAAEEQAWTAAWAAACAECWLGEDGTVPTLPAVREMLAALTELGPALAAREGLIDRIGKMEQDQAEFRDAVFAVAAMIGVPAEGGPIEIAGRVETAVAAARADQTRKAGLLGRREEAAARQGRLSEAAAVHARRAAAVTGPLGVTSLAAAAEAVTAVGIRTELRRRSAEAEREILDTLRATTIADAQAALDGADAGALEGARIELQTRLEGQDQRLRELFAARGRAADKVDAIGGDAAVAAIEEERRTTLLEIEDGAMRYLRLRAGSAATEQALRIYRERHRGSMMRRASEAFSTISRGAYTGLATQPERDSEMLIALSAGGGSKRAEELSKGTRFQLYLALRVAGYAEFAASRAPVPFIADDIMETFDDLRAAEAFRLLAAMATVGQVIYLTHHRHLVEIARAACPGVRLHSLEG